MNQKGFTLVEALIVFAIFTVLAGLSTVFLYQSFFGSIKTNIVIEVKEEGERVLAFFEKRIIEASSAQITSTTLTLIYPNNSSVLFECLAPGVGTNGYINFVDTDGTTRSLTTQDLQTGVNVSSCSFSELSQSPTQTIEMAFTIKESVAAPGRTQYLARGTVGVEFKQTFSLRNVR